MSYVESVSPGNCPSALRLLLVAAFSALGMGLSGCGSKTAPVTTQAGPRVQAEDPLDAVRETLRRGNDVNAYRGAVQQLNVYIGSRPDQRPAALTDTEKDLLVKEFKLDKDEISEVSAVSFDLLDSHHLESCYLMRDAARSFTIDGMSPLQRAQAAFAWAMREVRLVERRTDLVPPHLVLRRGWGTARERAMVFLGLLTQQGIDGCMVAYPTTVQGRTVPRYWVVGALIDDGKGNQDIRLFDPGLGLPLPGPDDTKIATLAQVRTQPGILEPLRFNRGDYRYDVTDDQAARAEVYLACPLSALSPRMRLLQQILSPADSVKVAIDPVALMDRFRSATRSKAFQGHEVHVWNAPQDPNSPVRVLRAFLPQTEGGVDRPSPSGAPTAQTHRPRLNQFHLDLVPWNSLPDPIRELESQVNPGLRLRYSFLEGFLGFFLLPKMPRDLLLRGNLEEATTRLVQQLDRMNQNRAQRRLESGLEEQVAQWCKEARTAHANLLAAEARLAKTPTPEAQVEHQAAADKVKGVWDRSQKVMLLIQLATEDTLGAEMTYQLALCKQERAERLQARVDVAAKGGKPAETKGIRDAWQSADDWWRTYLNDFPTSEGVVAARRLRAGTLEMLGQRQEAAALLENLSGDLASLDGTARLYLARQLRTP